jgi:hypothetical protein
MTSLRSCATWRRAAAPTPRRSTAPSANRSAPARASTLPQRSRPARGRLPAPLPASRPCPFPPTPLHARTHLLQTCLRHCLPRSRPATTPATTFATCHPSPAPTRAACSSCRCQARAWIAAAQGCRPRLRVWGSCRCWTWLSTTSAAAPTTWQTSSTRSPVVPARSLPRCLLAPACPAHARGLVGVNQLLQLTRRQRPPVISPTPPSRPAFLRRTRVSAPHLGSPPLLPLDRSPASSAPSCATPRLRARCRAHSWAAPRSCCCQSAATKASPAPCQSASSTCAASERGGSPSPLTALLPGHPSADTDARDDALSS